MLSHRSTTKVQTFTVNFFFFIQTMGANPTNLFVHYFVRHPTNKNQIQEFVHKKFANANCDNNFSLIPSARALRNEGRLRDFSSASVLTIITDDVCLFRNLHNLFKPKDQNKSNKITSKHFFVGYIFFFVLFVLTLGIFQRFLFYRVVSITNNIFHT